MSSYLKTLFLFQLILLTCSPQVFAQSKNILDSNSEIIGLPLINNYSPSDYNATPQNWAIVQDDRGIMYFANTGGVLEYDGVSWRLIEVNNEVVRTIAIDKSGIIYVGGIDEFGYLAPDSIGKMKYVSLISLLPEKEREFGDIWSIWPSRRGVFFQSASHLFLIKKPVEFLQNPTTSDIKSWKAKTVFSPAFLVNEKYFIPESGIGLLSLINDSLSLVEGGEQFAHETIYDMLSYPPTENSGSPGNKILIGSGKNGFYIYDDKTFTKFKTGVDEYIQKNTLYFRGCVLKNDTYAFGTQTGGLILLDAEGNLLKIINKKNSLSDNTVWFVYPDNSGNLWLGLNNGIARIAYPSPVSLIDSRFGVDGIIFSVNEHNGILYLSTPNGIYFSFLNSGNDINSGFKLVQGINSESWGILNLDGYQIAATTHGVYKIENNRAVQIKTGWRFAYSFCKSEFNPKIIYVGLHDGLAKLIYENGEWIDGGRIPGVSEIITQIDEDGDGNLWLSTLNKGILKITTSNFGNNASYTILRYENKLKGKEVPFIILQNRIIFGTQNGLMGYDKIKNVFFPDSVFGQYFTNDFQVIDIKNDLNGNIWIAGIKKNNPEIGRIVFDKEENYKWESFPQLKIILENVPTFSPHKLFPDQLNKNLLWITQGDKLYRFNIKEAQNYSRENKFNTVIRKVNINGDSVIYAGAFNPDQLQLKKNEYQLTTGINSIELNYSSSSYFKEGSSKYRFLLEGFNSQWSDWTTETKKEYTNLSPGDYIFRVQAMDVLGDLSNKAAFSFYIPAPWYKTVWAFLALSLLIITGIWWFIKFRIGLLEKRNIELEAIVDKRTIEVRKQKDILEEQAKKLLELDRLKSNFFANISHEFRTPLTLIMGQINNLLDSSPNETERKKLKTALSNSKQLQALINRLLELSKLESGEFKIKVSATDLNLFLRKILSAFESLTDKQNIKLEFNKFGDDIRAYIDREKIEEVFNNLISNAIKFTPANGKIALSIFIEENQNEFVKIIVADTGIGINPGDVPKIFDRFYQVDSSQTREYEGTGIGLAIVKEIIQLHKGTISVKSATGKGTEFSIQLPLGKQKFINEPNVEIVEEPKEIFYPDSNEKLNSISDDNKEEVDEENLNKEVILVVEDNSDMRSFIKENLEQNYKVIEAKNGSEGVKKAFESIPDLIITDVMMPAMNGFELTEKVKSDTKTSHVPVIMLTAKADEESKLKGLDTGVDDYLIKPFSTKELHARVGNLIKLRRLLKEKYKEISAINPSEIDAKPIDQELLSKVFQTIKTHLEDPGFSVTILAEEVGMSVSQLNRKLNGLINQSAGKLIRSTKMDFASQLLKNKTGNISEIAYRIGFSDLSSFTNSFKEKFGISPSEFIKKID